jgi:hypothetical protein
MFFVVQGQERLMHCSKTTFLFDHLIGAQVHDIGHVEAERLGGFEVEDELELGRLLPSMAKDLGTNGRAIISACLACISSQSSSRVRYYRPRYHFVRSRVPLRVRHTD